MAYAFNPFTGNLDYYQKIFLGTLSSAPSTATDGQTYLNSTNDSYYVWYSGAWQLVATFSVSNSFLLLETGDFILLETGDKIILN